MPQSQRSAWITTIFLACVIAVLAGQRLATSEMWPPEFTGNDTYSRMVRVVELWASGAWYETHLDRIWPAGLTSHWTRPLDALIVALSLPLMLVLPAREALHLSGWMVAPVLHIATVAIIVFGLRRLLTAVELFFAAAAFVFVVPVYHNFISGRPDHNAIFILLMVVIVVSMARLFADPPERRSGLGLGVWLPIAVWANMSALLLAFAVPVLLGLRWLVCGRPWGRVNLNVALTALASCAACLLLERPWPDPFTVVEYDRISVAHLGVFAVMFLFWAVVQGIAAAHASTGWVRRALIAAPLAVAGLVMLYVAFPGFFAANWGIPGNAIYGATRAIFIEEYLPLLGQVDTASAGSLLLGLAERAVWVVYWIFGALTLAILMVARREGRWLWLSLLTVMALYLAVTWPPSPAWIQSMAALTAIGYGILVAQLFMSLGGLALWARVVGRSTVLLAVIVGPVVVQGVAANQDARTNLLERCGITAVAEFIDAELPPRPMLGIMGHADFGPHILYRTAHAVYSIPNHRFQPGYTLTYRVLEAETMADARRILDEADVDILLICDGDWPVEPDPTPGFRARLLGGDVPDWLSPMTLPEDAGQAMRAYRVHAEPG